MPEPIIYIRGSLPGERFIDSQSFAADAKAITSLREEEVEAISSALRDYQGFLDAKALESLISGIVKDKQSAARVTNFLLNMDRLFRRSKESIPSFIGRILEEIGKGLPEKQISEVEIQLLQNRIPKLIQGPPALGRQWKAERLAKAIGLSLEEVEIICDLRPVFNEERKVVEGMIPVTTLKVIVSDYDGLPIGLEARLTEGQVDELYEKADWAKIKLATLNQLLREKEINVPRTELNPSTDLQ